MQSVEEFNEVSRIIGTEMEYSVDLEEKNIKRILKQQNPDGQFIKNGGRLYPDIAGVVEFATPESLGPRQAVLYERSGELLVRQIFNNSMTPVHKRVIGSGVEVDRGSITTPTAGHHENYLTLRAVKDEAINNALLTHCASRVAINGAGVVLVQGDKVFYSIAQKVWGLCDEVSSGTTNKWKGIVNTRDEVHANGETWRRTHNISSDPNISDLAAWLTLATTSLCLRLIENGVDLDHLTLEDPMNAIFTWTQDLEMKATVPLKSGKRFTMLDVQESLATLANKLSQDVQLPNEEVEAIEHWLDVCDKLRNSSNQLIGEIDWITKRHIIQQKLDGSPLNELTLGKAVNLDLAYDMLGSGYGEQLRDKGIVATLATREQVEAASITPPQTRAARRVSLMNQEGSSNVSWAQIVVGNTLHEMLDPYDATGCTESVIGG